MYLALGQRCRLRSLIRAIAAWPLLLGAGPAAHADDAVFDMLFDLDRNASTGCGVASADGPIPGIELRLRTTIDLATEEVVSVSHASCIDSSTGSFGSETPVASPPWPIVPGEGTSGSSLIETRLPLSVVPFATLVDAHVTFTSDPLEDALTAPDGSVPGGGIPVVLGALPAPALGTLGVSILVTMLLVGALAAPADAWRARILMLLVAATSVTAPLVVRAALGDGTLRAWSPSEEVASDPRADTAEGADILRLFTALDTAQDTLFVRLDVLLGPPLCLDWGLVDPGTGYPCQQEPPPDQGPFGYAVAMTFDDGPSPATTPSILAILRGENVPATFFMLGRKLETAAEQALALEIHQDPLFEVANHTYDHADLTSVTPTEIASQIDTTSELLRAAVGDACLFPDYFRFPRGRSDCTAMELVRERGHGVAGVNIDPVDWCYADGGGYCPPARAPWVPDEYRNDMPGYAVQRLLTSGGGIMLMHDIHPNTVAELPAVISALRAAGATFVRLDDETLFPILNANVNPPEPPACCDGLVN